MFTNSILATTVAASFIPLAMTEQFVMYTPGGDDTSVERLDTILSPGQIFTHVHQLFGSDGLSSDMSYNSLLQSTCTTVGNAAGDSNAQDHSVYWHPSLYMEASDGSGYLRVPTNGHKLYYRDVGNPADKKADPFEFPAGFRMIAGDTDLRAPANSSNGQQITQWICHGNSQNEGAAGGFPQNVQDCPSYPGFNGAIHFPHCWNGQAFDQNNPGAHVAYPDGDVQGGPCPASHPTRIPHIFVENFFDLHSVVNKVKPNTFVLSHGDSTGFGWHYDFYNGWESGAIPTILASCPQGTWGNEDVGSCSGLKKGPKTSSCKLKTTYVENVDTPGQSLPGCNPISNTSPAAKYAAAALGVATSNCNAASNDHSAGTGPGSNASPSSPSVQSPSAAASAALQASSYAPAVGGNGAVYDAESATTPAAAYVPTTMATAAQGSQQTWGWYGGGFHKNVVDTGASGDDSSAFLTEADVVVTTIRSHVTAVPDMRPRHAHARAHAARRGRRHT